MEKVIDSVKKYREELGIFVFVISFLFFVEGVGCKIFTRFDFDSQAFLFWQYAAIEKYLPYRDIFYPYGLLFYFKDTNFFFQLLFYTIPAILFSLLYFLLKKIYASRLGALFLVGVFGIFIVRFIGVETIGRYGGATIYALFFAWLFSKQVLLRPMTVVAIGISIGLVFSLLNDQGVYATGLFLFFVLLNPLFHQQYGHFRQTAGKIVLSIALFMSSFMIGLLPLLWYLLLHNSFSAFVTMFLQNSDIALFAKTPFPPYAASPENIFTFLILFVTIGMVLSKRWIYKGKYGLLDFLQISIVLLLILLEQKSIIRSIDSQITFLSLLLYFFIFSYAVSFFRKEKLSFFYLFILLILVLFPLRPFQKNYVLAGTFNGTYCVGANTQYILEKYPQYQRVLSSIDRVFSYPGDPLWYVLLHQPIPYYPSNYEATPLYAQKKQIAFLKNEKVQYVIYNTNIHSIQDGVPDYVRTPEISAYIFTHFSPIEQIGSFLLLKRDETHDIFADKTFPLPASFAQFLLNVDMGSIPKSEAIYKWHYVRPSEIIGKRDGESIRTKNLFLLIQSVDKNDVTLALVTDTALKTTVTMKDCLKGCIVNVSKLPLFYTPRNIGKIETISGEITSLQFFKTKNSVFW